MKWYEIIFIFIVLLGAANTVYQIFKMAELDAKSRDLKHPKFWGLFASGGQNSGGLILYLLGRKNYSSDISEEGKAIIQSRKNKIGIGLIFIIVGAVGLILCIAL